MSKVLMPSVTCSPKDRSKHFICCFLIHGQNAAIIVGASSQKPFSSLQIATDQFDYFRHIERLADASSLQISEKLDGLKPSSLGEETSSGKNDNFPLTKFERRFSALGVPIYRLA